MSLVLPIQHKGKEELFLSIMKEEAISDLNTYQSDTINRGLLDDNNFIISSPTASGKTLMAKFAAISKLKNGLKLIYITPTKALANKIKFDFRSMGDVRIYDGDIKIKSERDIVGDIMIFTTEKLKNILNTLSTKFLKNVGLIVLDELQTISDNQRGVDLFFLMVRLRHYQKLEEGFDYKILAMSGTLDNIERYTRLLDARYYHNRNDKKKLKYFSAEVNNNKIELNRYKKLKEPYKKEEKIIPLELKNNYESYEQFKGKILPFYLDILVLSRKLMMFNKLIVFCTSKKQVKDLYKYMMKAEEGKELSSSILTHHGEQRKAERLMVESRLKSGNYKLVFCTTSLIYGVDFDFDAIILTSKGIYDKYKENDLDDVIKINQAIGRIGRRDQEASIYAIARERNQTEEILDMIDRLNIPLPKLHRKYGLQAIQRELLFMLQLEEFVIKDLVDYLDYIQIFYEEGEQFNLILDNIKQFLASPFVQYKTGSGDILPSKGFDIIEFLSNIENYNTEIILNADWSEYVNKKYSPKQCMEFLRRYCIEDSNDFEVLNYIVQTQQSLINAIGALPGYNVKYINAYLYHHYIKEDLMKDMDREEQRISTEIAYLIKFIKFCVENMLDIIYTNVYDEINTQTVDRITIQRDELLNKLSINENNYSRFAY